MLGGGRGQSGLGGWQRRLLLGPGFGFSTGLVGRDRVLAKVRRVSGSQAGCLWTGVSAALRRRGEASANRAVVGGSTLIGDCPFSFTWGTQLPRLALSSVVWHRPSVRASHQCPSVHPRGSQSENPRLPLAQPC